jgi:alpha-glucosidase (family GH31 glycosyl hydrolase)
MENKERLLDYHEFYEELVDKEYLPAKIDYIWTDKNKDFMREVLFAFYSIYSRLKKEEMMNPLLKLYAEVILAAYSHYPEEEGYF